MKVLFSPIRAQPLGTQTTRLKTQVKRGLDRVGEWLFPNPQVLIGWQPAALGPQIPNICLMAGQTSGSGGKPTDDLEASRKELSEVLKKNGYHDLSALDRVFPLIRSLPAQQQEHNLRVAFQLAEWHVSPPAIAPALLASLETLSKAVPDSVKSAAENRKRLDTFTCDFTKEEQIDFFRSLLCLTAESHETLLLLAAEDLISMRYLANGQASIKPGQAERALYATSWILKHLEYREAGGELEDLAFLHLDPEEYRHAEALQEKTAGINRAQALDKLRKTAQKLHVLLESLEIPHRLVYRVKRVSSTARKWQEKGRMQDINGLRIILAAARSRDCYEVLGIIKHYLKQEIEGEVWGEDQSEFDDYIEGRQPEEYRSLHALFRDFDDYPLEVQIRTEEMDHVAEFGAASHAGYKSKEKVAMIPSGLSHSEIANQRFKAKKEGMQQAGVYFVYDADGTLHKLVTGRANSPPSLLDFAFALEINSGLQATGGKVDDVNRELSKPLQSGQKAEIRTTSTMQPSPLRRAKIVSTPLARAVLAAAAHGTLSGNQLLNPEEIIAKGKRCFSSRLVPEAEASLERFHPRFKIGRPVLLFSLERISRRMGFANKDQLFLALGLLQKPNFLDEIRNQFAANSIMVSQRVEPRAASFEILCLDLPGVLTETLRILEKHHLKLVSLEQEPVPVSPYTLLRLQATRARFYLKDFLLDLRNLYQQISLPVLGSLPPQNLQLHLWIRTAFFSSETIQRVIGVILDLGGSIKKCKLPSNSLNQSTELQFSLQLPWRRKRRATFALRLAEQLREIRGVQQTIMM